MALYNRSNYIDIPKSLKWYHLPEPFTVYKNFIIYFDQQKIDKN